VKSIHTHHTTQEEDVISCWISTEAGSRQEDRDNLYRDTIDQAWGLQEVDSISHRTIQGVDYVDAQDPEAFSDAWFVRDARLCAKIENTWDFSKKFSATLIFSAGPNAGCRQRPTGSTARTLNKRASKRDEYEFFKACVKETMRTGLDAMVVAGCTVALLAQVSCGIYAGPHRQRIQAEFKELVDELLLEEVAPGRLRANYFGGVAVPMLLG